MFRIIQGVPGSGKSYYMVNYLCKFVKYDAFYCEHILNDNVLVISNIDSLRIKHMDLDELIKKYGFETFFSVANFEKIREVYRVKNIVLIIDEAQNYFDRKYYNQDVFYFFQYHRHLGVDVILGTQAANLLANALIPLCEHIVEAVPRSKSIVGNFTYHFKDKNNRFMYSKVLRKNQLIFDAYKSFEADEISKPKNVILHWLVVGAVLVVAGGLCFKIALAVVKSKSTSKKSVVRSSPVVLPSSSSPVVPVSSSPPVSTPIVNNPSNLPKKSVFSPLSSSGSALSSPFSVTDIVKNQSQLPRVTGSIKSGNVYRVLLSTGMVVQTTRPMSIGQTYIR